MPFEKRAMKVEVAVQPADLNGNPVDFLLRRSLCPLQKKIPGRGKICVPRRQCSKISTTHHQRQLRLDRGRIEQLLCQFHRIKFTQPLLDLRSLNQLGKQDHDRIFHAWRPGTFPVATASAKAPD